LWDSTSDRANGINWNVADNVCYSLQEEGWFKANGLNAATPKCVVSSIEQSPKHGKLVLQPDGVAYNYMPEQGFIGKDMIVFIVNAEGKKVLVMWPVNVTEHEFNGEGETSQLHNGFQIDASLASARQLNFSIADLPGGAVGQTIGKAAGKMNMLSVRPFAGNLKVT
jgi:hypothetical protein